MVRVLAALMVAAGLAGQALGAECPGQLVHRECASACPRVCGQPVAEMCMAMCNEGCACPDDKQWLEKESNKCHWVEENCPGGALKPSHGESAELLEDLFEGGGVW